MPKLPIVVILVTAVGLGVVNLLLRLRGERKPVLIGFHLLIGLGALELLVYFLKGANSGEGTPSGPFGNVAAGLLALAAFSGLLSPILARGSPGAAKALLATHVSFGLAGFFSALAWVYRL